MRSNFHVLRNIINMYVRVQYMVGKQILAKSISPKHLQYSKLCE